MTHIKALDKMLKSTARRNISNAAYQVEQRSFLRTMETGHQTLARLVFGTCPFYIGRSKDIYISIFNFVYILIIKNHNFEYSSELVG